MFFLKSNMCLCIYKSAICRNYIKTHYNSHDKIRLFVLYANVINLKKFAFSCYFYLNTYDMPGSFFAWSLNINRFNHNGSKARKTAESKCQVVKYWLQNNRKICLPNDLSLKIIYRSPWSKQISLLFRKKNWKQTKINKKPNLKDICLFL